ncbi:hypothetical protein [Phaeovulum veldkampii]|uniref:hypothetical protein n=1 Tax=Phaeovulum veldkampii TaxID=33049 RepID=UPI0010CF3906|nr:hypothetical protein [Phaeovulum veldkampii]TDQ56375.1 hypothetical protein EV658_11956 [Phaeovulum veldkampii DSM 11550]
MGSFRVLDETVGRWTWPDEEKLRIVMESYVPGARVEGGSFIEIGEKGAGS